MPRLTMVALAVAVVCALDPLGGTYRDAGAAVSSRKIRAIICDVFGHRCAAAIRVARCETGGTFNPRALGNAGERGLFQIHPIHFGRINEGRLFEPRYNSKIAFRMSRRGTNWGPWTCKP